LKATDCQIIEHIMYYCEVIDNLLARIKNDCSKFVDDDAFYLSVSMALLQIGELSNALSSDFRR
jgi:uncharacterized protein with HEPN domain